MERKSEDCHRHPSLRKVIPALQPLQGLPAERGGGEGLLRGAGAGQEGARKVQESQRVVRLCAPQDEG